MRLTVLLSLISIGFLSFFFPRGVFAQTNVDVSGNSEGSHTSVNVQTNTGGNTVCINGKCTTSSGNNGKSTVCINGKCTTSDGDIDMHSDDGNDNVHVGTTNSTTNVTQQSQEDTETSVTVNNNASSTASPSSTTTPKSKKQVKTHVFSWGEFLKGEMSFFKKLFGFNF